MLLFPLDVFFLVSLSSFSQGDLLQPVHPPVADDPHGLFRFLTDRHSLSHSFLNSFHSKAQDSLTHGDQISRNPRYMWLDNPKARVCFPVTDTILGGQWELGGWPIGDRLVICACTAPLHRYTTVHCTIMWLCPCTLPATGREVADSLQNCCTTKHIVLYPPLCEL